MLDRLINRMREALARVCGPESAYPAAAATAIAAAIREEEECGN